MKLVPAQANRNAYRESIARASSDLDVIRHIDTDNLQRDLGRLKRKRKPGQTIYRTRIDKCSVFKDRAEAVLAWPTLWSNIRDWAKEMNFGIVGAVWMGWTKDRRPWLTLHLEFIQDAQPAIKQLSA